MRILIEYGSKLDIQDNNGQPALNHAVMMGNAEIVQTLLKQGADAKVLTKDGFTIHEVNSLLII